MSEITLNSLPKTLDELKAMPQAALTVPEEVAALTVAALALYPENPAETEKIDTRKFFSICPPVWSIYRQDSHMVAVILFRFSRGIARVIHSTNS